MEKFHMLWFVLVMLAFIFAVYFIHRKPNRYQNKVVHIPHDLASVQEVYTETVDPD